MRDGLLGQAVPLALTREGRLRLLHEAAEALVAGTRPRREVELYVGSVLRAWLACGRSPFDRHARVSAPRGSHRTARVVLGELGLIADDVARPLK